MPVNVCVEHIFPTLMNAPSVPRLWFLNSIVQKEKKKKEPELLRDMVNSIAGSR